MMLALYKKLVLYLVPRLAARLRQKRTMYVLHHEEYFNLLAIYQSLPGRIFITRKSFPLDTLLERGVIPRSAVTLATNPLGILLFAWYLGTSKHILLNDACVWLHSVRFKAQQVIVQLWHASGAFKQFGVRSHQNASPRALRRVQRMYRNYSLVPVSSPEVVPIYAESFAIPEDRVQPLGVPRTDLYFNDTYRRTVHQRLMSRYPQLKDRKLVLYAPTYRDDHRERSLPLSLDGLSTAVGDEFIIAVKLHPMDRARVEDDGNQNVLDLSSSENVNDLLLVADLLITDYSSLVFEFSLLDRPMIFFAYDLERYTSQTRGLYYPFEEFTPGPIVKTQSELERCIQQGRFDMEPIRQFRERFMSACDGQSADRIAQTISALD